MNDIINRAKQSRFCVNKGYFLPLSLMKNIAIIPEGGSKRYLKRIFSFWKLTVIGSFLYNMHWRIAKLLMRSMSTDDETIKQTALAYG
jgi:hypothetical protein